MRTDERSRPTDRGAGAGATPEPPPTCVLAAELAWTGARFERGLGIEVLLDADRPGSIGRVAPLASFDASRVRRLEGRALLPGFTSAHSHAFQRALRGRGERFPAGAGSFWSWREAMYELVGSLDEEAFYRWSREAYEEMLAAGITSVGEFHYLHHAPGDQGAWRMDRALLRAARDAGIRLVLLATYYRTGGIGKPLAGAQERFRTASPAVFWEQVDALAAELDPRSQTLGCAVHSVRAASVEEIAELHAESVRRGMPFHVHLEEQRREIEECLAACGKTPAALLSESLAIDERFVAVHATHTRPADLERLLDAGAGVCLCPLTEANLGDGVPDLPRILGHEVRRRGEPRGRVSLGTDSNARLSMLEEMRWLEYAQRLVHERRGVCVDEEGSLAPRLLAAATSDGARAIGLEAGAIRTGALADLVAVDLAAPALGGWDEDSLADALVLGADERAIAGVCVGGAWRGEA